MGNENPQTRGQRKPGANWSLSDVTEFIEDCFDRDTILDVLMGYSAYWFPARLTLIVGREWVQLFAAEGWELDHTLPRDARRANVEGTALAIAQRVATGTPAEVGLGRLFDQLDIGAPVVRTVGIPIGDRIAIVLVGAVRDDAVDTSNLEAVAEVAGTQLEDVIRRAKSNSLPPPDERIPEFPAPQEHGSEAASDSAGPGTPTNVRHTQQLDSSPSPSSTLSAPRLAATEESEASEVSEGAEEESTDEPNPSATSFGLPFATKVAPDAAVEAAAEGERVAGAEESEGEDSSTVVGAPVTEDKFPGDLGDLGAESSGVTTMPPRGVGSEPSERTQLGGVTAQPNIVSQQRAENEFAGGKQTRKLDTDDDETAQPPGFSERPQSGRTKLGGMQGETRLVKEAIERQEGDETSRPDAEQSGADEQPDGWASARSKSGVPKAMILKPARGSGANKSKQPKKSAEPAKSAPAPDKPEPRPKTDREATRVAREPIPRRDKKITPKAPRGPGSDDDDIAAPALGAEDSGADESGDVSAKSSETMFGGGWTSDESTRKFEIEDEVDDAWFDYFADVAEDASAAEESDSEEALHFSLSEPSDDPHSLPPETLERLLDSGPEMVDMQEQFLILDSRDRARAMEAAEEVAAMGDTALEVLNLMFPGRVFLDRYQHPDELPPVSEHGPVLHALVRIGDPAVDVAKRHMTDSSNETRFYAVFLLTKINAEPALGELFPRLFDRDQQIRTIAADIVQGYTDSPGFDELIRTRLHDELLSDDVHVTVAAELLGELKDVEAIVSLIDALEEASASGVKQAIMNALRHITLHDWSSPYEWRQWWESARDETRQDWIVEALDASGEATRQRVYDEIQRIPGLDLNYHPDQPGKLRKRAQKQLRQWFASNS